MCFCDSKWCVVSQNGVSPSERLIMGFWYSTRCWFLIPLILQQWPFLLLLVEFWALHLQMTPRMEYITDHIAPAHISENIPSASSVRNVRRVSQAAMATRILIERKHRKTSGSGFSAGLEPQRQANQGKTLAEMMNELKNCRYLRNSTMDDE